MSTSASPIITVPPQPNEVSYNITELNLYPTLTAAEVPAGSVFDPNLPQKCWFRPLSAADDPYAIEYFGAWLVSADGGSIAYNGQALELSLQDASVVNIAPPVSVAANEAPPTGVAYSMPPMPVPARPLAANESGPSKVIGGWMVTRTDLAAAANVSSDPAAEASIAQVLSLVQAIKADTQAIRALLNKS
jgi:hypothetical protein